MHPIWIIVISIVISTILSFFMVILSRNALKHELEMERIIREQLKYESDKRELNTLMIQILDHPIKLVRDTEDGEELKEPDDDSSTEW